MPKHDRKSLGMAASHWAYEGITKEDFLRHLDMILYKLFANDPLHAVGYKEKTMAATRAEIHECLLDAPKGVRWVIMATDTFDGTTFPSYSCDPHLCLQEIERLRNTNMTRVHEVYDLTMPIDPQLMEPQAWHPPVICEHCWHVHCKECDKSDGYPAKGFKNINGLVLCNYCAENYERAEIEKQFDSFGLVKTLPKCLIQLGTLDGSPENSHYFINREPAQTSFSELIRVPGTAGSILDRYPEDEHILQRCEA